MITIRNLKKDYGEKRVLDIKSYDFEKEKIYCIFGPNGSGKTTFLNILGRLEDPSSGTILLDEKPIGRKDIGYLRQDPLLFDCSVFSNIELPLKIRKIKDRDRVSWIINELGIEKIKKKPPSSISYGELKKVALARACVFQPKILLLDEPTANIDLLSIEIIENFIRKINRENKTTIILTTHDILSSNRITNNVLSLINGRIEDFGIKNLFPCFFPKGKGLKEARIKEDVNIWVITEKEGHGHILISETAIILSKEPLISSCRNSLRGRVISLSELEKDKIQVVVDVSSLRFYSIITSISLSLLSITIGTPVYLSFKASDVKVI